MVEQVRAAAIYARISSDQDGTGLGVARQVEDCRVLADRVGWPVVAEYVDNDISAYSGKRRPRYRAMLADIRAGRVDAVLIYHLDRLTRRPVELEEFVETLSRSGARLKFVSGDADITTGDGLLVLRMLAAVAANESDSKKRRLERKHRELAEQGVPLRGGRYRPYGYAEDRVTIVPEEAAVIRALVARYLAGEAWHSLTAWTQAQGIKTSTGGEFTTMSLRTMLLSARIAGLRSHGGQVVAKGQWEAIIDPADRDRMLALVESRKRSGRRTPRRYLLSGLMRCSRCGHRLYAAARAEGRRYVCTQGPDHGGCGKIMIQAEPVEQLVTAGVLLRLTSPALADALAGRARDDEEASRLAAQVQADQDKRTELAAMFANNELDRAEWRAARDVIDTRLRRSQHRLAELTHTDALAGLDLAADDLAARFAELELERQHAIIATVVDHVVILPGKRGTQFVDPARVEPVWRL